MLTYKLWLEPDKNIPQFKRLGYKKVEVSVIKLMKEGIHPYSASEGKSHEDINHAVAKIFSIINNERVFPKELVQFGYCREISQCSCDNESESRLNANLNHIRENIYFVEDLPYLELIEIAKKRIKKIWSFVTAKNLAKAVHRYFDDLRTFLKQKDKTIKLSSRRDIDKYRLEKILSPEDFFDKEKILIYVAFPTKNFRACSIIKDMVTPEEYLSLTDEINRFRISLLGEEGGRWGRPEKLVYNCTRKDDILCLIPDFENNENRRSLAESVSSEWGRGTGRYCFNLPLEKLQKIGEMFQAKIDFPKLDYTKKPLESISSVKLKEKKLMTFFINIFIDKDFANKHIISVLKYYGKKTTGKKKELIEKLAELTAEVYKKRECELDTFFSSNRFIRVSGAKRCDAAEFRVLIDAPLQNILLTIYALKHLRGNTILEKSHVNSSFELIEVARALLNKDITLEGIFIKQGKN